MEGKKVKGGQNTEPTQEQLANRPPPPSGSGGRSIQYSDLEVIADQATLKACEILTRRGSIGVLFYEHDGHRISKSMDPTQAGGVFEPHVCVSKDHAPVDWEVAEMYAAILFAAVLRWERWGRLAHGTHVYGVL